MSRSLTAFTLLELLVSVAIMALLVGLVAMSLRGVRSSASRAESTGALRQILAGYAGYSNDHRQRLLPGYVDATLFGPGQPFEGHTAKLPAGEPLDPLDTQSYVWRLAPYLDDAWRAFFIDLDAGSLSNLQAEFESGVYGPYGDNSPPLGGISERPAYGLNSIFVGGDSAHGGAGVVNRNPWTPADPDDVMAATRMSHVKNPSRLIVFAPAAKAATSDPNEVYEDREVGFCELRPPFLDDTTGQWTDPQWAVGIGGLVEKTATGAYNGGAGLPIVRAGKNVTPIAHLDGSATVEPVTALWQDMGRWNPFEVGRRRTNP
ncbi:MAG: type II secretion system protein [Planctomycetota bacterium]|jgi:hypothetical protein